VTYTRNTGDESPGPSAPLSPQKPGLCPRTLPVVFLSSSPVLDPWGIFAMLFGLSGAIVIVKRGDPDQPFVAFAFFFFMSMFVFGLFRLISRLQ